MAFITGSRAYGRPRPDSDVDLVVLVSAQDLERLHTAVAQDRQGEKPGPDDDDYVAAGGFPFRFGSLNLIACTSRETFEVWLEGTQALKKRAPVERAAACDFFRGLRHKAGLPGK